jgi:hypothetical protein
MKTRTLLIISSSIELATGLAVIAAPSLVARILLSVSLTPGGEALSRVGGIGLFSLAIACWPRGDRELKQPATGLLVYNLLAALFLAYLRIGGGFHDYILVAACLLHAVLALLFFLARRSISTSTN